MRKANLLVCPRQGALRLVADLHARWGATRGTHPRAVGGGGTAPSPGRAGAPRCHPRSVSRQCPAVGSGPAAREEAQEKKEEMSGPTPRRLWKYVTRRLGLGSFLHSPGDGRKYPQIPAKTLLWALLIGQLLRECSFWFRQLDLAPFDRLIWPRPAGELSPSREPPPGLVGTGESALCFPSRCGNPRSLRISISGVSFHRPPFSFFFAPFFFLCACLQFSTEKYRARILQEQRSPTRSTRPIPGFCLFPSSLATFFLFQRSAETIRLRARLDNMGLVGQPVQHRLA